MLITTPTLPTRLRDDLLTAMKEQDTVATTTLRSLLGAFDNASAVPMTDEHVPVFGRSGDVPRKLLTESDYQDILIHEGFTRRSTALKLEQLGRFQDAARLNAEVLIISRYVDL